MATKGSRIPRLSWGTWSPWAQWGIVVLAGMAGIVILDRLFRPDDDVPNILLLAAILGIAAATALVRPLGRLSHLTRNLDAGSYLDTFLACAVVSWLSVRLLLAVAGNPRVQGAGLHIAHMLWGGALMLTAIIIGLVYVGRLRQWLVAVVSGLGFGLFIDELGKFITSNNDYFFRPAAALVYAIFVALYLLFRTLQRDPHITDRENLVNALEWLKEAVIRDHDPEAVDRARYYLRKVKSESAVTRELHHLLDSVAGDLPPAAGRRKATARRLVDAYYRVVHSAWFEPVAIGVFLILIATQILTDIQEIRSLLGVGPAYRLPGSHQILTFYNAIGMVIEGVAGVVGDILLLVGVILLTRARSFAYRLWKLGVLIIMFVSGVIGLYYFQFLALPQLTVDAVALGMVNSLIAGERRVQRTEVHLIRRSSRIPEEATRQSTREP